MNEQSSDPFNSGDDLSRSTSSSNILELLPIRVHEDIYVATARVRHILVYWLSGTSYDIDNIVILLLEAASECKLQITCCSFNSSV